MAGNGRRILIVDDDTLIRLLLVTVLSADGWDVLEAGSLAEADVVVQTAGPAVVVLDESLPDGSGLELALRLPDAAHVVLYSGRPYDGLPPGIDAVVPKAGSPDALVAHLAAL